MSHQSRTERRLNALHHITETEDYVRRLLGVCSSDRTSELGDQNVATIRRILDDVQHLRAKIVALNVTPT